MGIITSNQPADNLPKNFTYQRTKDLITQLNKFCKQNARDLGFLLNLRGSELQYNNSDWKRSIVPGTVVIQNNQQSRSYNIVLDSRSIFKVHETMKHFQIRLSESNVVTPQATPGGQINQCCICMQKVPTMMLPCYVFCYLIQHTFCPNCTQIHIVEKEQKKCPICRVQFHEDNNTLQKKIITVVGQQQNFINDLKQIVLGFMKELNSHQVRQIEKELKQKQRSQNKLMQQQ